LHRYLQQQLPNYNVEEHLGGAWYAFVRGVDMNQPENEAANGFYEFTPPVALIQALDQLLAIPEVTA
jgi:exodeoxyribonuclease V beta subunit